MLRAVFSLFILGALVVSCKSAPKKVEGGAGAGGDSATTGQGDSTNAPIVADKDNTFDPQGSDGGKISGLTTVYFEYDKSSLSASSRKQLAQNAEWIKTNGSVVVQIEGHTDARGSTEYNLALGERRARAVKDYLATLGVESKRLTIISYGKDKPIAQGENESAYGKNRRANFVPLAQ